MEPSIFQTIETYTLKKSRTEKGKIINQYLILKKIGEGSSGKVKLVENLENKQIYALKCFNKTILKKRIKLIKLPDGNSSYKTGLDDVRKEINIMKKLKNHPNIIKLYEIIEDINGDNLFIVLEYAEKGEIMIWDEDKQIFKHSLNENKYLDENLFRKMMRDILKALYYIHTLGIVHRDIKPLNIMIDENFKAKLADFGCSIEANPETFRIKGSEGTFHFMAPECLKCDGSEDGYDGRLADIWSLGITLYSMVYLKLPFFDFSLVELIENIRTKDVVFPKSRTISEDLKELIQRMLAKDPKKRINLIELIDSPWINKGLNKLNEELI